MMLVALLLRAFPRGFREEFGADLLGCVREAREALARDDLVSVAKFWMRVALDLLRAAAGERVLACRTRLAGMSMSATCGAILLAGAAANVLFDVLSPALSMGIGAMLLTGLATLAGGRLVMRARG
jgi:hypothetical protein